MHQIPRPWCRAALASAGVGPSLAAYITWSFSPHLARPQLRNNSRVDLSALEEELQEAVKFGE